MDEGRGRSPTAEHTQQRALLHTCRIRPHAAPTPHPPTTAPDTQAHARVHACSTSTPNTAQAPARTCSSRVGFSFSFIITTRCVTASVARPAVPMFTTTGRRRYLRACRGSGGGGRALRGQPPFPVPSLVSLL